MGMHVLYDKQKRLLTYFRRTTLRVWLLRSHGPGPTFGRLCTYTARSTRDLLGSGFIQLKVNIQYNKLTVN